MFADSRLTSRSSNFQNKKSPGAVTARGVTLTASLEYGQTLVDMPSQPNISLYSTKVGDLG
jgi:hypothetical protein